MEFSSDRLSHLSQNRKPATEDSSQRLRFEFEVTQQERMRSLSEMCSDASKSFYSMDTDKDGALSKNELASAGGKNRYLAERSGAIARLCRSDRFADDDIISYEDLTRARRIATETNLEINKLALAHSLETTAGRIGLASMAITGGAELVSTFRGVPMNGKLRLAGYGVALGGLALGFAEKRDLYFSTANLFSNDGDMDRYCNGTWTLNGDHFRMKLKLR